MTPDGYEPRDDLGEQAVSDLVMRGAKEGYGPALVEMLSEAFDRGVEASAREVEAVSKHAGGVEVGALRMLPFRVRTLKGGGR